MLIERILTHLIPLCAEVLLNGASGQRILTSLTMFQIATTCLACGGLLSRSEDDCFARQVLAILSFWLLLCLTVLLWMFGWIALRVHAPT